MNKIIIILLALVLFFVSCKNDGKKEGEVKTNTAVTTNNIQVPPAIPTERLIYLFENTNYLDFIFADLPFSMSQEDKSSIQQTIRYINPVAPASINPQCASFADLIFQVEGEIVSEAKIFFQPECTYYLIYENGELKYSASFTDEGIKFFNNLLQQAEQVRSNG